MAIVVGVRDRTGKSSHPLLLPTLTLQIFFFIPLTVSYSLPVLCYPLSLPPYIKEKFGRDQPTLFRKFRFENARLINDSVPDPLRVPLLPVPLEHCFKHGERRGWGDPLVFFKAGEIKQVFAYTFEGGGIHLVYFLNGNRGRGDMYKL